MPIDTYAYPYFWTSKEFKGNTNYAYVFNPYYGLYRSSAFDIYLKTKIYKVLCVSGDEMLPATSADFMTQTISGKVVVTDSKTGLMWQKTYETNKTWLEALKYCEDSTYAGFTDWRVPNKNELLSLVNYEKSEAPYSYFPDMPNNHFMSSSTRLDHTYYAMLVDFNYGALDGIEKPIRSNVMCVRSEESQEANCTDLPANAEWNSVSSITQKWNGDFWYPSARGVYNEEASTEECRFKCVANYVWNGIECVATACITDNPCISIENGNGECFGTLEGYSCGCNDGYFWNGEECKFPLTIGNICTGQNKCYTDYDGNFISAGAFIPCPAEEEALFGQDAQYAALGTCTPQSFTAGTGAQAGTVIDNNTLLIWEGSLSENTYTWDDAPNHCADLNNSNYGGINTWRVPNPLELMTIIDNSRYKPATNSIFTNMPTESTYLWTSKEYKTDTSKAYELSLNDGDYSYNTKTYTYKVLCVSGEEMLPATSADFTTQTINGEDVVTDSKTALMWQKKYTRGAWETALFYCEDLTYAGYSDWRLPNKNEIASLVNYEKPGAPYSYFPDTMSYNFWASSTEIRNPYTAFNAEFRSGYVGSSRKDNNYYVRCVRTVPDQCDPNPCTEIANSNGGCLSDQRGGYVCGCADGYLWNDDNKTCEDPCDPNPCTGDLNLTGICTVTETSWKCGCVDGGYTWNGSPCILPLGNICTGQTKCYNNDKENGEITCPAEGEDFFGQDTQHTDKCIAQSFTLGTGTQAGTVIDNNTGLIWEQSPSEETYTWPNRATHCNELNSSNYGGINTWRVPNPLELLTIVDNSKYNPATNSNFTNIPTDKSLWTSKKYKGGNYAYAFSPSSGSYSASYPQTTISTAYKILCVSGDEMQPATSANFTTQTISDSVVVTDSATGLMWQKEYAENKKWQEALKYCEDLAYAGYSDWRLPNKNELASLVNYEKSTAPYSDFPDMPSKYFWSSSTYTRNTGYAWGMDLNYGMSSSTKTDKNYVRCVRNAD